MLWALDELKNIYKHRRVLLTNLMAGQAQRENIVEKDGQILYQTGPGPTPCLMAIQSSGLTRSSTERCMWILTTSKDQARRE